MQLSQYLKQGRQLVGGGEEHGGVSEVMRSLEDFPEVEAKSTVEKQAPAASSGRPPPGEWRASPLGLVDGAASMG